MLYHLSHQRSTGELKPQGKPLLAYFPSKFQVLPSENLHFNTFFGELELKMKEAFVFIYLFCVF